MTFAEQLHNAKQNLRRITEMNYDPIEHLIDTANGCGVQICSIDSDLFSFEQGLSFIPPKPVEYIKIDFGMTI